MVYGSETWAMNVEQIGGILQWVSSVSLRDTMGIEPVTEFVKRNRLGWLGQVLRKGDGDWVKISSFYEVDGVSQGGRLRMTWNEVVEKDTRYRNSHKTDCCHSC